MKPDLSVGFHFTAIWFDEGTIQLCISAWNRSFAGTIEVYEAHGKLEKAAASLAGFPLNSADKREIVFGNFDPKWAGGGLRMRFHCVDGAGHAYVEAEMNSKYESGGTVQTALLSMPVEPAAVDAFVQELKAVGISRAGRAYLKGPGLQR